MDAGAEESTIQMGRGAHFLALALLFGWAFEGCDEPEGCAPSIAN